MGSSRARRLRRIVRPARLRLFMMPTEPDGDRYGYLRGDPIDRRYIDEFLSAQRTLIRGRCLEIGETRYLDKFGGRDVDTIDVLDVDTENDEATIIGDLQQLGHVPSESFDCIIVTQVMQYLQEPAAGVHELHRMLAPGGSALVTLPTSGPVDIKDHDRWRFMPPGAFDLFSPVFGPDNITVNSYGNLLTGLAFWAGLAQQDLPAKAWESDHPNYPLIVTIRATRVLDPS
jgi:SAM-dependent methyltransferase